MRDTAIRAGETYDAYIHRNTSEAALQAQVEQIARLNGWRVYHTHDSRRSTAGFPDLTLARGPRLIFAELKRQTGRVTVEQQRWLDALAACPGVETYVWRPADRDDAIRTLTDPDASGR